MKFTIPLVLLILCLSISAQNEDPLVIQWDINRLDTIGGQPVTVYGNPIVVETDSGKAVEFDGIDDGLLVPLNPMAGANEFSIEIVFKPYSGGLKEQRFIHMQQDDNNRALIELRSIDNNWFLDTYIKSNGNGKALYAENDLHPSDKWWHACLVYSNNTMTHYVNGVKELSDAITFVPVTTGVTSIGVRQNLVSWYKGAIKTLKVTHKALLPEEFLYNDPVTPTALNPHENQFNNDFRVFPNPADSEATIAYNLADEASVMLKIYNLQSEEIMHLANGKQSAGSQQVSFSREHLPAGVYLCILEIDQVAFSKKLMLLD